MTRYFYKDPLKAAIAVRDFGVKIYSPETDEYQEEIYSWRRCLDGCDGFRDDVGPFDIHPDSVHLLMPRVGDWVKCPKIYALVVDDDSMWEHTILLSDALRLFNDGKLSIAERNGLYFPWPEWE